MTFPANDSFSIPLLAPPLAVGKPGAATNPCGSRPFIRPSIRGPVRFQIGATEWRCYCPTGAPIQKPAKPERSLFVRFFRTVLSLLSAHGAEHATKDVFNERHKS